MKKKNLSAKRQLARQREWKARNWERLCRCLGREWSRQNMRWELVAVAHTVRRHHARPISQTHATSISPWRRCWLWSAPAFTLHTQLTQVFNLSFKVQNLRICACGVCVLVNLCLCYYYFFFLAFWLCDYLCVFVNCDCVCLWLSLLYYIEKRV